MQFAVEDRGSYVEIAAPERLNMLSASRLKAVVAEVVGSGMPRIVVNLEETEFMDSSGLGALVACLKQVRQAGGDLRIASVPQQVVMVLELTGMHRVLSPYPDAGSAYAGD